jgi:aromatase
MANTDNAIVVNAPRQAVWDAMNDLENWPNLFTEYASLEILARDGDMTRFRLTTHPDDEHDGQVWSWVSERTIDPASYTSHARRVETGPFAFMEIDWQFEEVPDGTRMTWRQHFSMRPEAPNDDEQATEYLNRNTRIQMRAVKERLEAVLVPIG